MLELKNFSKTDLYSLFKEKGDKHKIFEELESSNKIKKFPEYNYYSVFESVSREIYRFGEQGKDILEIPPDSSEFYNIAITSKCHGGCKWCYAKATSKGEDYEDICDTWKAWMDTMDENSKPFFVKIGSIGEPTEHPDFVDFLETVYNSDVSPSYTTNGIILGTPGDPRASEILDATEKYCKSVSVSLGNKNLQRYQKKAILALKNTGVKIILNHIISDKKSVDDFIKTWRDEEDYIHVLLPLLDPFQKISVPEEVSDFLRSEILKYEMDNIILVDYKSLGLYSKNIILKNKKIIITKNSFDLRPLKIIKI